jgi:hypothetical protein
MGLAFVRICGSAGNREQTAGSPDSRDGDVVVHMEDRNLLQLALQEHDVLRIARTNLVCQRASSAQMPRAAQGATRRSTLLSGPWIR